MKDGEEIIPFKDTGFDVTSILKDIDHKIEMKANHHLSKFPREVLRARRDNIKKAFVLYRFNFRDCNKFLYNSIGLDFEMKNITGLTGANREAD